MKFDVNEMRDAAIAIHGIDVGDRAYVMYYDETNNIRRLHVRADGLNAPDPQCFVVGGIAHAGSVRLIDLTDLRETLRIQPSAAELKLKHIAKGDFLELIDNPRTETFLSWISEQGFFVHFSVLDPLYWSIVDVVDSILGEYGEPALTMHHMLLKNDLYAVLRHDYDRTIALFQQYEYPNVGAARRVQFVSEVLDLAEDHRALLLPFNFMMLKGVLQIANRLESLPFLEDVEPNVLLDGFGPVFVERLCLLTNSSHILDVEEVIKKSLSDIEFYDGDEVLKHYRFAISHDEPGIQLSDVVTGLMGKFFSFICETPADQLQPSRESLSLSVQQGRTLNLIGQLFDRAISENPVFAHYVMSLSDREKALAFLGQ